MKINFRQGIVSYQSDGFLQVVGDDVSLLATNRSVTITVAHKDTDYTHSEDNSVNNAWTGPFTETNYWLYWNFDPLTFARTFGSTTHRPVAQSVAPGNSDEAITGVLIGTGSPITSAFIVNGSYSHTIGKPFAVIGSTENDGNYTVSSVSIGGSPLQTTIYVNEPVNSTVVDGSVTLDVDSNGNPLKVEGRHWYDTSINVHYVLNGSVWRPVLRIFAAQLLNGKIFIGINQNSNTDDFTGTQIGNNTTVFSGRVMFDESGEPIYRDDATFFTTEDQFFTNQSHIAALRLESNITSAQCVDASLSSFSVVAWTNDGQVTAANYDDAGSVVVGLLTENLTNLEVGGIIIQGVVTNPVWNWSAVGAPLWIENGLLVTTDPNINDPTTYPIARIPVARVLDENTVIFEERLGDIGIQGPQGIPPELLPADTTNLGSTTLLTPSSDSAKALVISDTDARLSDARISLTHTHQATDITVQPDGGIVSREAQSAILELGSGKLNLSGGNMTGFLTLYADPTAIDHPATKQYVDNVNVNKLKLSGDSLTDFLTLSADPTTDGHASTKQYVDSAASQGGHAENPPHATLDAHMTDTTIHFDILDGFSDVDISGSPPLPLNGQVLKYNGTTGKWENQTGVSQEAFDAIVEEVDSQEVINNITSERVLLGNWNYYTIAAGSYQKIAWISQVNLFVTVSSAISLTILTSPDGINWTARTTPAFTGQGKAISWSNILGKIVVAVTSGFLESTDAITWTYRTIGIVSTIHGMAESSSLMVLGIDGGGYETALSSDGINWTYYHLLVRNNNDVTYSSTLNKFYSIDSTGYIYSSSDGVTWTGTGDAGVGTNWQTIEWIPTLNILIALDISLTTTSVAVSANGSTWTPITTSAAYSWTGVAWAEELQTLVVSGQYTSGPDLVPVIMKSTNGYDWTTTSYIHETNVFQQGMAWSPTLAIFCSVATSWADGGPYKVLLNI